MGYPVAYRPSGKAASAAPSPSPGSQFPGRPSSWGLGIGGEVVPFPWGRGETFPKPVPGFGPPIKPNVPFGRYVPPGVAGAVVRGGLGRLVPYIGWGLLAWDVLQWIKGTTPNREPDYWGYQLVVPPGRCPKEPAAKWFSDRQAFPTCGDKYVVLNSLAGFVVPRPPNFSVWWQTPQRYLDIPGFGYWSGYERWERVVENGPAQNWSQPQPSPRPNYITPPAYAPKPNIPNSNPVPDANPNGQPHPVFDPYTPNPPLRPEEPVPQPIPWSVIPYVSNPGNWPQYREGGNYGVPAPTYTSPPWEIVIDIPVSPGGPGTNPGGSPDPGTNPNPGGQPVTPVRTNPRHIPRSRPPRGDKEKKTRAKNAAVLGFIGGSLGALSEANDVIDALYEALPREYQSGGNFVDRAHDVLEHFDHIDAAQAIQNLVLNELEDRAIGRAFGYSPAGFPKGALNNILRAFDTGASM